MSICSCSFRALPRSRISPSKTLTPFLYQTATIQRCRRYASSRPNHEDHIPFENEKPSFSNHDADPARKTTITGSERAAFEKLYKKFNTESKLPPRHEIDQVADEYYEDDEDNDPSAASLDTLFDAVLSGVQNSHTPTTLNKAHKGLRSGNLASLAEDVLHDDAVQAKRKSKKDAALKSAQVKKMLGQERERVRKLLEAANTDVELWGVLEREVFGVIKHLDLDGAKRQHGGTEGPKKKGTGKKSKSAQKSISSTSTEPIAAIAPQIPASSVETTNDTLEGGLSRHDPRIVFPNYPFHLIVAAQTLRTNFPSSPLPLSIIPTLKSLGRSSYALGATTSLYKIMLRTAWLQHHSYTQVCSLLQDMDSGGIESDYGILNLLDEIIAEYKLLRSGKLGKGLQAVLAMEQFDDGIKRLRAWRDMVAKRLGAWSEKRVDQSELVRRIRPGMQMKDGGHPAPRDDLVLKSLSEDAAEIEASAHDMPLVEGEVGEVNSLTENGVEIQAKYSDEGPGVEDESLPSAQDIQKKSES